jgi:hypothetical protein
MGWWKTAKPGDKVICVDDTTRYAPRALNIRSPQDVGLRAGCIYVFDGPGETHPIFSDVPTVRVAGLDHPGIYAGRFRPVQTKSTDTGMAILKAILNGQRQPERDGV